MARTIPFKGYVIDIDKKNNYKVTKDGHIIAVCDKIPFVSSEDAEVHAKMYVKKHVMQKGGWFVS